MKTRTSVVREPSLRAHPLADAVRTCLRHRPTTQIVPATAIALLLTMGATGAATIVVDEVHCTLVDAIEAANRNSVVGECAAGDDLNDGGDQVDLTSDVTLTAVNNGVDGPNGLPSVTSAITISGNHHLITRTEARGDPAFRLLHVSATGRLVLNRVTLTGGFAMGPSYLGGGLFNLGTVILADGMLSENFNGGLANFGNATITRSSIAGNLANGLYNEGRLTLTDSDVSATQSAGWSAVENKGVLTLERSRVTGSHGDFEGTIRNRGDLTAIQSEISHNFSVYETGGLLNFGTATLVGSTISDNGTYNGQGGGIANSGNLIVDHSTLVDNSAFRGGGLSNSGSTTFVNSTVSGNRAVWYDWEGYGYSGYGGGIDQVEGALSLTSCTLSDNENINPEWLDVPDIRGSGLMVHGGAVTLTNTIIANSSKGDCIYAGDWRKGSGTIMFEGINLIEDCGCNAGALGQLTGDPNLGPLTDNGGPTLTHALLPGSRAIDRVDPGFIPPSEHDQRGEGFDRVRNGRIDIGAFEVQIGSVSGGGAWLKSLGDVNRDGTPEIATVARAGGKTVATVKDAADGALVSRFELGANLLPVDVETMDAFGSGFASSLVLLGKEFSTGSTAETRDVLTGDLLGSVAFNPKLAPVDLTVLPDQGGNGIPELGMLGRGSTRVEILDALSGDPVGSLPFAPSFEPRQVITLPDLNGNARAEVGVLLAKPDATDRIVVKDTLSDEKLETLGTWWSGEHDLLEAVPVTDPDGNATANVAMLLHDAATGKILVRVANARTNVTAATVRGYNPSFAPVKLVQVADINGNGLDEYALLARNSGTGQVTAEVRDGAGGVSRMWFGSECTPLDLTTIADINDNGAEELVMLGRCGTDGSLKAVVKDAKTGETLNRMSF